MAPVIDLVIQNLNNFGLYTYILPFLLFFAVIFGIMENGSILSKRREIQLLVSFVISLLAILSPIGPSMANFLALYSARIGVIMVGILFGLITLMVVYRVIQESRDRPVDLGSLPSWIFFGCVVVAIILFATSGGLDLLGVSMNWFRIPGEWIAYIGVIGFTIAICGFLYYIAGQDKRKKDKDEREQKRRWLKLVGFKTD